MIAFLRGTHPKLLLCFLLISSSFSAGCANNLPGETSQVATTGWKIKFDGSGSSPVIADGVLYVGSADGAVYAVDPKTGETKWRFQTGDSLSPATSVPQVITVPRGTNVGDQMIAGTSAAKNHIAAGIRRVDMTPAVENGTVFIGAGDHSFYAIDAATGKKKWSYVAGPGMASKIYVSYPVPAPIVHDGIVYCATQDGLHALDMTTGQRKWFFGVPSLTKRPAKGLVRGEAAIFLTGNGYLYAVAPDSGTTRWVTTLDGRDVTEPVAAKGRVFVATHPSISSSDRLETLYAIDVVDGKVQWKLVAERKFGTSWLLIAGDMIYFSTDRMLLAVEQETGRRLWSFSADEIHGDIGADDQHVYVITHKGSYARPKDTLHALALTTGQEKWSQELSGGVYLVMVHDGIVYVDRDAIDAATGKKLWSFRGTGRESATLISGGRIFLE